MKKLLFVFVFSTYLLYHKSILKPLFSSFFIQLVNPFIPQCSFFSRKLNQIPCLEKGKHTKFQQLWVGPFQIAAKLGSSTHKLQDLQGWEENLPVNGLVLKPYFS